MIVDFKHSPGELVKMKIDSSNTPYMVLTMTHDNGGNYYKIFDGETELLRSEFELEKIKGKGERRAGFKGKNSVKIIESAGIYIDE